MYADSVFFNDTATTEIYTLSLHDALPISSRSTWCSSPAPRAQPNDARRLGRSRRERHTSLSGRTRSYRRVWSSRSEEHTSELQSRQYLVCRLLLEKKTVPTNRPLSPPSTS